MSAHPELLPCPFCGVAPTVMPNPETIVCVRCGIGFDKLGEGCSLDRQAAHWNTRTPDPAALTAQLTEAIDRIVRLEAVGELNATAHAVQRQRIENELARHTHMEAAHAALVERVRELESDLAFAEAGRREVTQVLTDLRAEVTALREERDAARAEVGDWNALRNDRDRARREGRKAREEAETLRRQVEAQQDAYEALAEEVAVLRVKTDGDKAREAMSKLVRCEAEHRDRLADLIRRARPYLVCPEELDAEVDEAIATATTSPTVIEALCAAKDHAQIAALEAEVARLRDAILWACGVRGEFPIRREGQGAYYWRKELRERAGISDAELNAAALRGEGDPSCLGCHGKSVAHTCGGEGE